MKLDRNSPKNARQAKIFFTVLALIFYVMFAALVLQHWHKLVSALFVSASSEQTTAQIKESQLRQFSSGRGADESDRFEIKYTFTVDGKQYTGTDEIPARAIPPEKLTVKYNPGNPSYNQAANTFYTLAFVGAVLGVFALSLAAMVFFYLYIAQKKQLYKHLVMTLLLALIALVYYLKRYGHSF